MIGSHSTFTHSSKWQGFNTHLHYCLIDSHSTARSTEKRSNQIEITINDYAQCRILPIFCSCITSLPSLHDLNSHCPHFSVSTSSSMVFNIPACLSTSNSKPHKRIGDQIKQERDLFAEVGIN